MPRTIDIHAHYVPPRAVAEVSSAPERYGFAVEQVGSTDRLLWPTTGPSRPMAAGLRDLRERAGRLKSTNIDCQLIGNWMEATGYGLEPEQAALWSRLVNESTAQDVESCRGSFVALAQLPMQDGRLAADELGYAVTCLGMKGAMIATHVAGRNLDDPTLEPLWRVASELKAPIVLHPEYPLGGPRLQAYEAESLMAYPFETLIAAAALIFGGVCDRFPDLRIVLLHGGGHFPYQVGRLAKGYEVRTAPREKCRRPPTDYLSWFYYDTLLYSSRALRFLLDSVGPGRVMLGSDTPFDMSPENPIAIVADSCCSPLEEEQVRGLNAAAAFELDGQC